MQDNAKRFLKILAKQYRCTCNDCDDCNDEQHMVDNTLTEKEKDFYCKQRKRRIFK